MKILHVFKTYYPDTYGGIEQVVFQLCEGGKEYGWESEVFCLSPKGNQSFKYHNHLVHTAKQNYYIASTGFSISAFKQFRKLAGQFDIVHYHFPWPFMDLLHLANGIKTPTVLTYHSDIIKQKMLLKVYKPLMNRFLRDISKIVVTSPNYLETSSVLQQFSEKTSIIPIGIQKDVVQNFERVRYWRERLPAQYFLFVGALRYYKGLIYLLEAQRQHDFPLVIIGSGPLEEELKSKAHEYGLQNCIFLGAVPDEDKNIIMELSYAIVFPSHLRSEAFGITLVEGLMHGKPLISCEIGTGTSFINQDNETGIVIPPRNSRALAEAMNKLWVDPSLAFRYGKNALIRYQTMFTRELMLERYDWLYRSLLSEK